MKLVLKRVTELILFLFILSAVSFIFIQAAPGDPVRSMMKTDDTAVSEEEMDELREEMGFNDPIFLQYGKWVTRFFQFDLGTSYSTNQPVLDMLLERIPSTLELTFASLAVMTLIAVPIGTLSALYKGSWIDHASRVFALAGSAVPSFWLGLLFIQFFSVKLGILPSMGMDSLAHLVLPSLTLGIAMASVYARILRSSLLESLNQDFILSARARGLHPARIFFYHALRNSLAPVITIFGISLGSLLGGTVVIEVLFSYPGAGKLVVDAMIKRDYPVIQGYILFMGLFVSCINLLVDLSYRYVNPELRVKEAGRR
ncbi:ABC transporter permease subunit [Bacillus mangrovi]|uniref:Nickel import system permease protein NikB n=1 Tax=Metabacillus mangrovi TaxID=1491830 RepID=A0A7X2S687_9BACI|nr:ABC transporter permease subunit [Metabacillus mangrovi]